MLVLTVLNGPQTGRRIEVRGDRLVFGRGWMNDASFPEFDHVSGRHGELVKVGDRWDYSDLGSTNGSALKRADDGGFVDLRGDVRTVEGLEDGDELHLGDPADPVRLSIDLAGDPAAASGTVMTRLGERSGSASDRILLDATIGASFQRFLGRLLDDLDLDRVQKVLADMVLETFESVNHVALFAPAREEPDQVVHREGCEPKKAFRFPRGLLKRVRGEGEPVLFRDAGEELGIDAGSALALQVVSGFCVPLKGPGGEDAGVLVADSRSGDMARSGTNPVKAVQAGTLGPLGSISLDDLELVATFAHHAGRVIGAAREREEKAAELRRLEAENRRLAAATTARDRLGGMIGAHPTFLEAIARVERVAKFPTAVLIEGETGTGKEGTARAVHQLSDRRDASFVAVNVAAIPRELLESQLFGYEKGAFTGADRATPGLFEEADGGTLFLDEIGEMPLELQAKLLRVLQEGEVHRVGARRVTEVDVRIVAATHRSLADEARAGRFRDDLLYRLNVFPIPLPALRDRASDIPALANHFATAYGERFGRGAMTIDSGAMRRLEAEEWPGNIRELENRIQRAAILAEGTTITARDVAPPGDELLEATGTHEGAAPVSRGGALLLADGCVMPMKEARNRFARLQAQEALAQAGGVQKRAAELLDLDPGNFSRLLRDLGLR